MVSSVSGVPGQISKTRDDWVHFQVDAFSVDPITVFNAVRDEEIVDVAASQRNQTANLPLEEKRRLKSRGDPPSFDQLGGELDP